MGMGRDIAGPLWDRRGLLAAGLAAGATWALHPGGAGGQEGRRIAIGAGGPYRIEGSRAHRLSDVIFEVDAERSGNGAGLEIGGGARIDVLRIRIAPGVRRLDRFVTIGQGAQIGLLDVEAAEQTDPNDDKLDGFVQIRNDDVRIEAMRFNRIDRCLMIHRAARVWIGAFDCTSYSKGIRLEQARDVHVGRLQARGRSPHAAPEPGNNGLSIADCERLAFPEVVIEDAAEHAIYLAGGGGRERRSGDIRFGQVVTRRAGQCGFKCKAPESGSRNISIERLEVVDSAYRSRPGRNEDALRVENARDFRVGWLEVRPERARTSCHAGVYLDGVRDFALAGGRIEGPAGPMVMMGDHRGRGSEGISITSLDGVRLNSHGYLVAYENGSRLKGLDVEGGLLDGVAGDVVRLEGNVRLVPGTNRIRVSAQNVRGAAFRDGGSNQGMEVRVAMG
jgi:hypothetical protein